MAKTYPYFYDMLDRGRNLGLFLGNLTERVAASEAAKRGARARNRALLNDPGISPFYKPWVPYVTRGGEPVDPWWPSPDSEGEDQAPDDLGVHPQEGSGVE